MITAVRKAFRVACMYVSPKAIWECALDQGSENKVIDLGLPFIILEILIQFTLPKPYFLNSEMGIMILVY